MIRLVPVRVRALLVVARASAAYVLGRIGKDEHDNRVAAAGLAVGREALHVRTTAEILACAGTDREWLGQRVRQEWRAWARQQPDVRDHATWTVRWPDLPERDREVDRRIGEELFRAGWEARDGQKGSR